MIDRWRAAAISWNLLGCWSYCFFMLPVSFCGVVFSTAAAAAAAAAAATGWGWLGCCYCCRCIPIFVNENAANSCWWQPSRYKGRWVVDGSLAGKRYVSSAGHRTPAMLLENRAARTFTQTYTHTHAHRDTGSQHIRRPHRVDMVTSTEIPIDTHK